MDAGEILDVAQKIDPNINRVTVYRTLELLKHLGLIDELDLLHLRGHRHFYESHGPRDHIHVACIHCGKVREFESDLYEELKQQISRDCGIEITISRTEVGGVCNSSAGVALWLKNLRAHPDNKEIPEGQLLPYSNANRIMDNT